MRRRALAALALAAALAGCATVPPPVPSAPRAEGNWSGRMALTVLGAAGTPDPAQAFSAAFQLQGTPQAGKLALFSPIGSTVAELQWAPGEARLVSGGTPRSYESLDALVAAATGTPIPVAALFDWLAGRPTPVPGWQPDLSRQSEGRISARRTSPPPEADLRVVLER